MSREQKMKATTWKRTVKHEPSVVCPKDTRMKESQYWLMEHPVQLPPVVRGGCECRGMKPLWYRQYHRDGTEPAGQLARTCKQAELGVQEFMSHFLTSVSA